MLTIRDTQGFSGIAPITPSRGFNVEILTGVTPSWKIKSNRGIYTVEDKISGWLQYYYKIYCKKGGCCRRQACIIER